MQSLPTIMEDEPFEETKDSRYRNETIIIKERVEAV